MFGGIGGDIAPFEKYFPEFCNSFEKVKKSCNGILSVKRIVKYFEDIELPIKLKPDDGIGKTTKYELLCEHFLNDGQEIANHHFHLIKHFKGHLLKNIYK